MADLNVPVTKSKGVVVINTDNLPDEVYKEALLQGLKVLVNRGMSKITKATSKDEDEMKALAQTQAEKNVEAIMAGKIKFSSGTKAKRASGAVMTEARRLARNLVKDEIKRSGGKISHYEASEITKAANALIDADPELLKMAEENIKARDAVPVASKIDLSSIIHTSPKLIAKAEAEKAAKKAQLSAKQAGMTKKSKKAEAAPTAN